MNLFDPTPADALSRGSAARRLSTQEGLAQPDDHRGARQQAWLREMEKAQVSGWFLPFRESVSVPATDKHDGLGAERAAAPSRAPVAFLTIAQSSGAELHGQPSTDGDSRQAVAVSQSELEKLDAGTVTEGAAVARSAKAGDMSMQTAREPAGVLRRQTGMPGEGMWQANSYATENLRSHDLDDPSVRASPVSVPATDPTPAMALQPRFVAALKAIVAAPFASISIPVQDLADGLATAVGTPRVSWSVATTRLHSVWTADGLNLWLGMDGTADQVRFQASMIVNTLQHTLKSHGQRLHRVVCNGIVIFDAASADSLSPSDFLSELRRGAGHALPEVRFFSSPKEF